MLSDLVRGSGLTGALWGLAWLGSTPIGGSIVGWIVQDAGARWSLVVGGLPTVVCGLLALPALTRIDRAVPPLAPRTTPPRTPRHAPHGHSPAGIS